MQRSLGSLQSFSEIGDLFRLPFEDLDREADRVRVSGVMLLRPLVRGAKRIQIDRDLFFHVSSSCTPFDIA